MALVTLGELIKRAEKSNCAVGAFSVGNLEMVLGAVRAAEETNTPIILQIAEVRLKTSPLELMGPLMLAAAKNSSVDIAVHLDHGLTRGCIDKALEIGFTSVMLDASLLAFEENIKATESVIEKARAYGASVEAELGVVGGNEGGGNAHKILYTQPALAKEFCERTGIDALAVAIGNAHGNYPVLPALRFDVLEKIASLTDTPLVLHGGTGITADMFRTAISLGIRKINIATASFDALAGHAKEYCSGTEKANYFELSTAMAKGVYENVRKHIEIFNCEV
ncbi:MAG: ketose-bisphosphate aldolase [Clostridiales bacterium]|nr:ketose-bisphosphate aldolase [Clostridiales bacterium]